MSALKYNLTQLKELLENNNGVFSQYFKEELLKNKEVYKNLLNWKDKSSFTSTVFELILNKKVDVFYSLLNLGLIDIGLRDGNGRAVLAHAIKLDSDVAPMLLNYIVLNNIPYPSWSSNCDVLDSTYKNNNIRIEQTMFYALKSKLNKYLPWVLVRSSPIIKDTDLCDYVMNFFAYQIKTEGAKPIDRISGLVERLNDMVDCVNEIQHPLGKLLYAMDKELIQSFAVRMLTENIEKKNEYYAKMVVCLEKVLLVEDVKMKDLKVNINRGKL